MSDAAPKGSARTALYDTVFIALSTLSMAILVADALRITNGEATRLLRSLDNIVCGLFAIEFGLTAWRQPKGRRLRYVWSGDGILSLLSIIPANIGEGWFRGARLLRFTRIFRAIKATRHIARATTNHGRETTLLALALVILFLMFGSSIAIVEFEDIDNPATPIKTATDAMWWAICTLSSADAGDLHPMTSGGRAVGVLLMAAGVGMFATASGLMASVLVSSREQDVSLGDLKALLVDVRASQQRRGRRRRRS